MTSNREQLESRIAYFMAKSQGALFVGNRTEAKRLAALAEVERAELAKVS